MTQVVILAAGHGKRMKSDIPKVLQKIKGRPILLRLVESVKKSGVSDKPVVVVGKDSGLIRESLGGSCYYAVQEEQFGTGHAVASAERELQGANNVLVLYGDHPFLRPETIKKLNDLHLASKGPLTMMTIKLSDFHGWREVFRDFGRVVRNENGEIVRIVEKKDASAEELEIKEVSPSLFCFKADWLWENIKKLKNNNSQKEYYLTDLVSLAMSEGHKIASVEVEDKESLGLNTPEQLAIAESLI